MTAVRVAFQLAPRAVFVAPACAARAVLVVLASAASAVRDADQRFYSAVLVPAAWIARVELVKSAR